MRCTRNLTGACSANSKAKLGRFHLVNICDGEQGCIPSTCPMRKRQSKIKVNGIKKVLMSSKMLGMHNQLLANQYRTRSFGAFWFQNHVLQTVEINKECLDTLHDKRYILEEEITTLAYGHKDVACSDWIKRHIEMLCCGYLRFDYCTFLIIMILSLLLCFLNFVLWKLRWTNFET